MGHHLPQVKKAWFRITKKGKVMHCVAAMAGCVCMAGSASAFIPSDFTISTAVTTEQHLGTGGTGTITSTGSITVVDPAAVSIDGDNITLINEGLISSTSGETSEGKGINAKYFNNSAMSNFGTITVAGEDRGTGVGVDQDIYNSTISNSGTITVTSAGKAAGVEVDDMYGSTINNSGTITVNGDMAFGVMVDSLSESSIINSGLIRANSQEYAAIGVAAVFMSESTSVTNTGTIEVINGNSGTSYYNAGILSFVGDVGSSIANEGTISVTVAGDSYISGGILSKYNIGTISNSGTITLTQDNPSTGYFPAAGIANLFGTPTISNSGTIQALNSNGTISSNNFSVYTPGGNVINETNGVLKGLLFVGGEAEVSSHSKRQMASVETVGNFENKGTIFLPLPATDGPVAGTSGYVKNLVNSGTIGITLFNDDDSANTRHSILQVGDSAELRDGSTIHVDVTSATQHQKLMIGETLEGVIQAGSIVADTDLLKSTDNSALLKFTPFLSHDNTWLDLNIEQARTILEATISSGKNGVTGAAAALDSLTESDDPDIRDFIAGLNNYESEDEVAEGVVQASPVIATSSPIVTAGVLNTMSTVVQSRLQSVRGGNSGDQMFSDRNLWVKPLGAYTEQDNRDGINGFSANSYGLGIGADGDYGDGKRLGLALFYTGVDVDSKGVDQDNDLDVFNLSAYGSNPVFDDSTELFYQLGAGLQQTDSSRYIDTAGETAKADFTSKSLFAQLKGTKTLQVNDNLKTMFGMGLSYMYFYNPSYTETGAGGLNLHVDSFDSNALVASLEGDVFYDLGSGFQLLGSAGLGYDLIDDDTSVNSNFQGASQTVFATEGIDNSPFIFNVGLGLAKEIQDNLSLDLKYDLDYRSSDYENHVVTAQLNWKF